MNETANKDIKTTDLAPFSVRVNDDVKARLKQLQEASGATQPDFYRSLVALYTEHKSMRGEKSQEEEDIANAVSVITNSTLSLINRLHDTKKSQKISAERYSADLDELNVKLEESREYSTSLLGEIDKKNADYEELKQQLDQQTVIMQEKIEDVKRKAANDIENVKNTMQKKINNLQTVANAINEISEQGKSVKQALQKAEHEASQSSEILQHEKNKVTTLENSNRDLKVTIDSCQNENNRLKMEIDALKEELSTITLRLSNESIAKSRIEGKLEILEPQISILNKEIAALRSSYKNSN